MPFTLCTKVHYFLDCVHVVGDGVHMNARRTARPDARRAVVYTRVSTDGQELSPEAQVAACAQWAARRGITIVATVQESVSGGAEVADRPGLLQALAELRTAGAGVLLVANRSRLARDVMQAAVAEGLARKAGATIESADGVGEGSDPTAALLRHIVDAFAQYERAQIASRTRAALAVKRARGEYIGMAPLGTQVAADGVHLVENANEAAMLRRCRTLLADGMTVRATAATLAAEGFTTRTGKMPHPTTVQRIRTQMLAEVAA